MPTCLLTSIRPLTSLPPFFLPADAAAAASTARATHPRAYGWGSARAVVTLGLVMAWATRLTHNYLRRENWWWVRVCGEAVMRRSSWNRPFVSSLARGVLDDDARGDYIATLHRSSVHRRPLATVVDVRFGEREDWRYADMRRDLGARWWWASFFAVSLAQVRGECSTACSRGKEDGASLPYDEGRLDAPRDDDASLSEGLIASPDKDQPDGVVATRRPRAARRRRHRRRPRVARRRRHPSAARRSASSPPSPAARSLVVVATVVGRAFARARCSTRCSSA